MLLRNGFDCKIEQKYVDPAGKYVGVQAQISDENYYIQLLHSTFTPCSREKRRHCL